MAGSSEPSIDKILNRMPVQLYSVGEVAKKVSRSTSTVRRWRKDGWLIPSFVYYMGDLRVPLYTEADVERASTLSGTIRRGPKPSHLRVAGSG